MTGLLTRVMHERADATSPDVDLDAIINEGNRRVRRQRATNGLVAAVVAGTVAAGAVSVPLLLGGTADPDLAATAPPGEFEPRRTSYAIGGEIHWGTHTYRIGERVASFVPTDNGFVYTTADGTVSLFDGNGSDPLGTAEGNRLRADDQGSLVAWVELAEDGHPQYVVFDTAKRAEVARVDDRSAGASVEPHDQGAEVFAVDDGSIYWRHGADLVRYDVPAAKESLLATGTRSRILDVAYGTLAYAVEQDGSTAAAVGQRVDVEAPPVARASNVLLSPDARYLAAEENDNIAVYDVRSGETVTPDTSGYPFAVVVDWVDDDTTTVLAVDEMADDGTASGDVLRCDIGGPCAPVGSFADLEGEELIPPVGDPMS